MRVILLELCVLLVAGVFAAMFLAIWGARHATAHEVSSRQSFFTELVWAAIPCLMVVAAAIPAVIAILGGHSGD